MDKYQKQALQVAKEVVIKFIEVGRISPNNFGQNFDVIYKDIMRTVTGVTAGDGSREAELAEGVEDEADFPEQDD
ncbi:hypothetical protein [Pseudodesulfovibrio pelocollis]|uniref:hypothetical protein n=1 Tax=Pseudodesulfovibrio pelocollis TaxID=3051432 RepID=UPI00255B3681|nr:hypothetical protein [Pseudodesulfovibrio sp. SB368]